MNLDSLSEAQRNEMKERIKKLLPYIGVTGVVGLLVEISNEYYQQEKERGASPEAGEWAAVGSELESAKFRIYEMVRDGIRSSVQ